MANEYTGRKEAIGIAKESVAGTPEAAPSIWIPKDAGVLNPQFTRAEDKSGRGTIFPVLSKATVEKFTQLALSGVVSDNFIGYLLLAALGTVSEVIGVTITGATGGTPAKGDSISSATGAWTASIKKVIVVGATTYIWIKKLTGTVSAQTDVTNGTWTGGTLAIKVATGGHFFEVAQTNTHQTFTLFGSNPIGDEVAGYGMLDTLSIKAVAKDFIKFTSDWMAKALATTTGLAPAYTDENQFLAKHAAVKFGANEAALNAASALSTQGFDFAIAKSLEKIVDLGDADVAAIANLTFGLTGSFEVVFRDTTLRDYVTNDTSKAARIQLIQTNAAKVYDPAGDDDIYPSLYIDLDKIVFEGAPKTDANDEIVKQTVGFTALPSSGVMVEMLLINTNATGY